MTVDAVIQHHPRTASVFNRYGIDACCGGGLAIATSTLRRALTPVIGEAA